MSEATPPIQTPTSSSTQPEPSLTPEQRRVVVIVLICGFLIIAGVIALVVFLSTHPEQATLWRDVFIVLMAIESMFIGLALIILMIQVARLTNLLQHEIKPILQNTNDTINTVRGTAIFVSENLVDPVMKLNSYIAAIGKFFELINVLSKK